MATPAPELRPDDGRDVERGRDPSTGRFLPGYKGGRKHRIDLLSLCDRKAREEGFQLEALLWGVVKGLMLAAAMGDAAAARLLFDKLTVISKENVAVRLGLDVEVSTGGPAKVPSHEQLARYFEELQTVSAELRNGNGKRIEAKPVASGVTDPGVKDVLSELLG